MNDITVLGIFVADISFSGNKIPSTGETILGDSYNIGPGGKGCNQAIAISRLGGKVNFISKLGNDDYGKLAIDKLKKDNIDTSGIIISNKHKTGVAGIHVDRNTGKNAITVVRGAPSSLTTKEIDTKGYKDNYIFPFVVGAAFAFGWTPCIGPILGSILALSATDASISKGILLLSFYSLGLAIPFILSGYYMNRFIISKKGFGKYYNRITKTGGAILLITGILIATNQIQVISYYILTTFPFLTSLG